MDTNPFAMSPNTPQAPSQTPAFLQQQPNNPTMAGQASNMVKALMEGNDQFKQAQMLKDVIANRNATAPSPMTTNGMPSVGSPMSLAPPAPGPMAPATPMPPAAMAPPMPPPVAPQGMQGGAPLGGVTPPSPFTNGAPPVDIDPMTQALFSQIPGVGGA